jgi:putative flippase GtrA
MIRRALARHRMLLRYAVVGAMAFCIDFAVTLPAATVMHYVVANSIGFVVANLAQFLVAHGWVFGRPYRWRNLHVPYVATLAISALGLALSNAIVYAGIEWAGIELAASKVVAAGVVLVSNFALRRLTVYRDA